MPSVYLETFGCQMNEADSRYVAERARAAGYSVASQADDANVVVLNTCTVRENAERRAYGRMQHFRALKLADPTVKLVVMGCLAEQDRARMQTVAPHVDAVFGTSELLALGDALAGWRSQFDDDEFVDERLLAAPLGGQADCVAGTFSHLRAFVTVQRGCSYYCTFCIVPHVRGRFDHRPRRDIIAEVESAVAAGAREIMLVGQTVNAYREPASGTDFADLLEEVSALDGLERLTFVTSHPKDYTEKLARTMGSLPKLNPRFHLPFQSGSNAVLRRMNRKYSVERYLELVDMFRSYCPGWALTTDIIVGFPGETAADFEQTLAVCERAAFAQAYMFVYSPRRGTPAAKWEPVPEATRAERLRTLRALVDEGVTAYHRAKIGTVVRALATGSPPRQPDRVAAKTTDNVTVFAPMPACGQEALATMPWFDVRIERAHVWGCAGTVVGVAGGYGAKSRPVEQPAFDLISAIA